MYALGLPVCRLPNQARIGSFPSNNGIAPKCVIELSRRRDERRNGRSATEAGVKEFGTVLCNPAVRGPGHRTDRGLDSAHITSTFVVRSAVEARREAGFLFEDTVGDPR